MVLRAGLRVAVQLSNNQHANWTGCHANFGNTNIVLVEWQVKVLRSIQLWFGGETYIKIFDMSAHPLSLRMWSKYHSRDCSSSVCGIQVCTTWIYYLWDYRCYLSRKSQCQKWVLPVNCHLFIYYSQPQKDVGKPNFNPRGSRCSIELHVIGRCQTWHN